MKILIAGGRGLIGSALSEQLSNLGFEVSILSRDPKKVAAYKGYAWDPEADFIDPAAVVDKDYIINLTGESIASGLWTKKRLARIVSSRTKSVKLLSEALKKTNSKPKKILNASAIGYYGNRPDEIVTEDSIKGMGQMSSICKQWESSFSNYPIPAVALRIGVVLSKKGGFYTSIAQPIKFRINAIPGNGKQKLSWIHIDDLVRAIIFILNQEKPESIYNLVSPNSVSTTEMQKSIADNLNVKPLTFKIPAGMLRLLTGSFSEIFLNSQDILPSNLLKQGFDFRYKTLKKALKAV